MKAMVNTIKDVPNYARELAKKLVQENGCKMAGIIRASEHVEESYLYYVIVKDKRDKYISWLMNGSTEMLNLGRYDFETHAECLLDVLKNRVTYKKNPGV